MSHDENGKVNGKGPDTEVVPKAQRRQYSYEYKRRILVEVLLVRGARLRTFIRYNSPRDPTEVIETNVIGTLNILLAGHQAVIERLVHTSTSEVYGTAQLPGVHLTFLDE